MDKRWAHIGIEEDEAFEEIFFSTPANQIIVQVHRNDDPLRLMSLFGRSASEGTYRRLTPRSENRSYTDPVLAASAPLVFINAWKKTKMKNDMIGGDWIGISSLNLKTDELKQVVDGKQLTDELKCEAAWASRLLSASADGKTINCSIGVDKESRIVYWLCTLALPSCAIEKISELPDTFL